MERSGRKVISMASFIFELPTRCLFMFGPMKICIKKKKKVKKCRMSLGSEGQSYIRTAS